MVIMSIPCKVNYMDKDIMGKSDIKKRYGQEWLGKDREYEVVP